MIQICVENHAEKNVTSMCEFKEIKNIWQLIAAFDCRQQGLSDDSLMSASILSEEDFNKLWQVVQAISLEKRVFTKLMGIVSTILRPGPLDKLDSQKKEDCAKLIEELEKISQEKQNLEEFIEKLEQVKPTLEDFKAWLKEFIKVLKQFNQKHQNIKSLIESFKEMIEHV